MKSRVAIITLLLLALSLPHSAESTNTVESKAVGVIRVAVAPTNSVLSALPVAPFDSRISRVFQNSDLAPGTNAGTADNVLLFDPALAQYDVYFRNSALGNIWVKAPETNETTNTLSPGTGFFIQNRNPTATAEVFFAGAVILADSNSVTVPQNLSLRSYLFTSAARLSNLTLKTLGTASTVQTNADEITETVGYQQFWLYAPGTGGPPRWVDANTNASTWVAEIARGFWYNNRGTNQGGFLWTEPRPYAAGPFNQPGPPQVTGMTFNAGLDEVALSISSTGAQERLEIFYRDLEPNSVLALTSDFSAAALNLLSPGPSAQWTDQGGEGRGKINTVFGRAYVVNSFTDSDGDGLSNLYEMYLGTDPNDADSDNDGANDGAEINYGTDPNHAASYPTTISGTISYGGAQTGTIYVLAAPTSVGFPMNRSTTISAPGSFGLTNIPTLNNYWLKAFRDSNGNGAVSPCEARGEYASNPVFLTNTLSGISITLLNDTNAPVLSGVPAGTIVQSNSIPAVTNVTATDAYEGSVSVTFSATTNVFSDFRLYLGSNAQGLSGHTLTGFTNALLGFGSRSHENFSSYTVSPPDFTNLTTEIEGITCVVQHRDDTGTPPTGGAVRTFRIEDPVSQDSADGSGAGIDENTGSSTNRNMFVLSFSAGVGHVGLDGLDIESGPTGTLARLRAYDSTNGLLVSTNMYYPGGENGNQQVHFIGLTSDKANIRTLTITVGDPSGNGNSQHLAFDNLRFGSSTAPDIEIIRTWSASDSCGNSVTATQVVSVVETTEGGGLPPLPTSFNVDPDIWINEIHYDNSGVDTNEGVEIAGWAETDLKDYDLVFYNGAFGTVYKTVPLSGTIDNEQCGIGAVWFPVNAIENGPADGIALVKDSLTVKQFLSYEGVLTALDGPASGFTSTNIGVSEASSSPADYSVQLVGTGTAYAAFLWRLPTNASPGALNSGQSIDCGEAQQQAKLGTAQSPLDIVGINLISNRLEVAIASSNNVGLSRIELFSYDAGDGQTTFQGLSNFWRLAASGLILDGTNPTIFVDRGQLGRPLFSEVQNRFYGAGASDVDNDNDGLPNSHEIFTHHTSPTNADTDGDGVSDGPFDPDNNGSIIAGPDAFPLSGSTSADTDGDGLAENADPDDDNDGLLDSVETNGFDRIIPITIAPYKEVSVQNVDPSGDDNGTEDFDVSSAGRSLPYALGANAAGGFGKLHGGIYFNHDSSNLYVAVAGFEKDGNNAMLLFLDSDGTNGGANSLDSVSGAPLGFGDANNLSFNATSFTPNVGILIGSRSGDGQNFTNFNFGAENFGQGAYLLSQTNIGHFPGFSNAVGGFISQWGDRGSDSANAGIEIALRLNSLGLTTGSFFKAAAIIGGGASGGTRFFSGEAYGQSVIGSLDPNNFGHSNITLIGSEVYVSSVVAPTYSDPPPFTENDVMLQGYQWDVPFQPDNGNWYDHLRGQAASNEFYNFSMMWMPPPSKGNSDSTTPPPQHNNSVGYDPFDYYDLGTYEEKFSTETRYGSESELRNCINALRSRGITPMVDLVFNHNVGGFNSEGGTGQYNFAYGNHNTFEKKDPTGKNANSYYNTNAASEPFSFQTIFGPDVNIQHPYQRLGLKGWGDWVTTKAGYQAYRWDLTQNLEPWFIAEFMSHGLKKGQFSVMEYWQEDEDATISENETWLALTDYRAAIFDMRLHELLVLMCEDNGTTFNMGSLNRAGVMGSKPQWSVTFVESHDTIRPYGGGGKLGISKDKAMAYAFILISEGLPMVAYNDYFIGPVADQLTPDDPVDDGWTGTPLTNEINRLVDARRRFVSGTTAYLSTVNTNDLLIIKRNGTGSKPGCILVLNDNVSIALSNTVNTGWASTNLVDLINTNHVVTTDGGGNAALGAQPRSYRVYIRQGDL